MKKIFSFILIIFSCINLHAQTTAQIYNSAMDAYNSHDYATAERIFQKFFFGYNIYDGLYATAKYYSGDALLNLGEKAAAAGEFEFFVNQFHWSSFRDKALYKLGLIYFEQGQYDKCRSRLITLIKDYPESDYSGSSLYWIGETYSKEKKLNDAITFFKNAVGNQDNNNFIDYSLYTLANTYEKEYDYKNAEKYYDTLITYHSNSPLVPAAHIRIGYCHFKLKQYDSAILELNDPVVKTLPPDVYSEGLYILGNSYYQIKDYQKAENNFLSIINNYPFSKELRDAKYGLAWAYFQQKKYEDAYKFFNELSSGNDSLAINSFYWKAESKRYAGQEIAAFDIYQDFLNKYPNDQLINEVQYQLGVLYYNTGKYELAEKYLGNAVKSANNDIKARAYTMLGEIALNKKDFNSAEQIFNEAIATPDISSDLVDRSILGLGVAQYYAQKYEAAISNLSDINFRDPKFESDKVNFYLAECFYSLGKYKDAIEKFDQVSSNNDELANLSLYGKAYCYFNQKEYATAAKYFSEYVKLFPDNVRAVDANLRLADSYYGSKNFVASSKVYKEMFRNDKRIFNDPNAYYQFAQALYKANDIQDAITEFQNLQKKFPNSDYADKSLFTVGWIYFQKGNYQQAISTYRNVLAIYPNSSLAPTVFYSIGDSYFNLGQYDSAITSYQQVLTKFPTSPHVYDAVNGIQDCYVIQNKQDQAINFIRQFIANNPSLSFSDQIFYKVGDIYYSLQNYKQAEISYREFIADYPNSKLVPQAYYWIGKSAENLKKYDEALSDFNSVFTSFPNSDAAPAAVIEMGNIYNQQKKYDDALTMYNKALTTLPNKLRFTEIMFNKGMTYVNKNDFASATLVFNQIVKDYSGTVFSEKSKLELGILSLQAKNYSLADSYLTNLAQNRSDDIGAQAQFYLGQSLYNQKNYSAAITALSRVSSVFPAYDDWVTKSYLLLGDCYEKTKDRSRAREMYRIVISKHGKDKYGREASIKLRRIR